MRTSPRSLSRETPMRSEADTRTGPCGRHTMQRGNWGRKLWSLEKEMMSEPEEKV